MKKIFVISTIVLSCLFMVRISMAQTGSYNDAAPKKKVTRPYRTVLSGGKENSIQSNHSIALSDKDPNAKATPIPSEDMFDLIFEYPCAIGGGEAGIETDGIFIYTTKWNGNQFYKYDIDGTFIDSLIISGVSNIRDLAWDGTYFFGGAASPTVYELDFENATLISTFTAPTEVRAIAYNEDDDIFYANNWSSDITKFDKAGNNLGSFSVGPVGDSYYGFAFEGSSYTGLDPALWGYAQTGSTQNELIQISLPDGIETGVNFNVGSVVSIVEGIAGGLCTHPVCNVYALIGIAQNEIIWGIELYFGWMPLNDLGVQSIIEPASGVGGYTNNEPVTVRIENYGWDPQTDFIVSFSHNGSPPYFDTAFTTIISGDTYDFTFDTTINMSMGGTHTIEACTYLNGDECVFNDCKIKMISGPGLCEPGYTSGCLCGDGFISFAVGEIQNYGSGCEDNMGHPGWSQYLSLGAASFIPGETYEFIISTGWDNNFATIWIDFNDDLILTEDEKVLENFEMVDAGQMYSVQVSIPSDASEGLHYMRARTNRDNLCNDPCEEYDYGEAEDYYISIETTVYGFLEGYVTNCLTGEPLDGATVICGTYASITGPDRYYSISDILPGTYNIGCSYFGFCPYDTTITFYPNQVISLDIELCPPQFLVEPDTIEITLPPNSIESFTLNLSNPGVCSVDWSASVNIISKDEFDLLFQYPVGVGGGEAGIETDGFYLYTTKWNGNEFYKYDIDGTYMNSFTIDGVSNIRDLAWDGTYFYGGAASTTVYEMDFDAQSLVSSFLAPTEVRAIAYNENDNVFYANDWGSDITCFDPTGGFVSSWPVGPVGDSYYGFAFDNATGYYLWGYAQVGATLNELVQMELPSGYETGYTLDIASVLNGQVSSIAGGLFIETGMPVGLFVIGGLVQNEWLWGIGQASCPWVFLDPVYGTLAPGATEDMTGHVYSGDLLPGMHEAVITLTTDPNTGPHVVHVFLNVISLEPPINFSTSFDCVEAELCWDMPPNCYPDSFSVYNNGQLIINTTNYCYTFAGPGYYECYVTAWYSGQQSAPSDIIMFEIPWPADSEPVNFAIDTLINNIVYTSWDEPPGCAEPDGYNVYRDGIKLNDSIILHTFYPDTFAPSAGVYEYYATTVYFFGESDPSNIDLLVITNIDEVKNKRIQIYPVPASNYINIRSSYTIKNIRVLNNTGQIVIDEEVNAMNYKINISKYESGIYYIKLETEGGIIIRKIVVE